MKLEVLIPTRVVVREPQVSAVVAEGLEGSFGVLPRHVDYVSALVPGILAYRAGDPEREHLLAVDRGLLVKVADAVRVSVRDAVEGEDLATLRATVEERFRTLDDEERKARSALATLEVRFIRRFVEEARHGRD